MFSYLAETGSFRAAATKLKLSVNTVRAKVARIEHHTGEALLLRGYSGVKLTPAGLRLRAIANSMRGAAVADGIENSAYLRRANELRIGTSEGLGSGWLTPRLLDLQQQFPDLTMAMMCDNDLEHDNSDDVDIGVVWHLPRNPNLVVAKLATLHIMPFASRDYIKQNGMPRTPEDLLDHRFIELTSPGVRSELLDQLVGTDRPPGFLPIRTNSSLAVFWAVANDAGIAYMPTYVTSLVSKLVPVDLPFRLKFDIFYYFHPEARACPIVRAGIEWLKQCFDPVKYPWFRSEFVHPNEFFPNSDGVVVPLFTSLAGK
ncbi:MAG: LysR family transcriptional regulator [Pseudomonadota bacterium]|nr:LysR family transcriptional regulator [Pseudomonadota bacterium]